MPFSIGDVVSRAVGPVMDGLDDLFTSEQEKKKAERMLVEVRQRVQEQLIGVKKQLIEKRGAAVVAEAEGESVLQRSWRPILMLTFGALVVLHWLGLAGVDLPPNVVEWVYELIKLGVGGYVIGRSGEKITRVAADGASRYAEAKASEAKARPKRRGGSAPPGAASDVSEPREDAPTAW